MDGLNYLDAICYAAVIYQLTGSVSHNRDGYIQIILHRVQCYEDELYVDQRDLSF
jgi:hypothetical protein